MTPPFAPASLTKASISKMPHPIASRYFHPVVYISNRIDHHQDPTKYPLRYKRSTRLAIVIQEPETVTPLRAIKATDFKVDIGSHNLHGPFTIHTGVERRDSPCDLAYQRTSLVRDLSLPGGNGLQTEPCAFISFDPERDGRKYPLNAVADRIGAELTPNVALCRWFGRPFPSGGPPRRHRPVRISAEVKYVLGYRVEFSEPRYVVQTRVFFGFFFFFFFFCWCLFVLLLGS